MDILERFKELYCWNLQEYMANFIVLMVQQEFMLMEVKLGG